MSGSIGQKLLNLDKLCLSYEKAERGRADVVSQASLSLDRGETLCIAGESGCGKSTLLKAILGLPSLGVVVTGGRIDFEGRDLTTMPLRERRRLLGGEIGLIPQDPAASFNPIRTYEKQFAETLASHGLSVSRDALLERLGRLRLQDGEKLLRACPYEMSGGMKQRLAIALSTLLRPKLLLCDEPTSALDVVAQKAVVEELLRLREECGAAMLIVTHNLALAAMMADRTGIMCAGRIVEYGDTRRVLTAPDHPYTRRLIAAIPHFQRGPHEGRAS